MDNTRISGVLNFGSIPNGDAITYKIRIISNNELTLTQKDKSTHCTVQDFAIRYVDRLLDTRSK